MGSYASGTWSSGPVNLTFSCTDNESGSGCAPAYPLHCVDRTNTCTPEESGSTLALTESGTWYVRYFSQDLAENTEEIQSQIVHIACGAACDVASPYAKTTILPDGKWSPWEWNDAKDTYFWFNGDAQHEDGNIHVYTKNDDRFIYALYDVVPDITNEPDVECYTASGCDWATLNISYDGEDYNCTIWSNGTSDGCSGVSFQDGFSGTVNSATPHRFWEFKLDLGYFEIPEGATVKVTAGGYGTLSERRTGYPWTYPERICSSGTCAELESTAQNGFDLTLNTPFTTTPNVAWSFVVSSDSESENKCGGNILDAALFDQNGSGLKDFSILTQPGRMLYSAYSINGNDGSQIWVNHDYHGDRLAVGNVYNKSSGDETIVGDMTDGSRIVVLSNTGAYLADFSDITGRITSIRLADLDSDGVMEIVLGTNTSIYVLKVTENDE